MMNQYGNRFGRVGNRMGGCGDASPYRRPQSRDGMLRQSFNRSGGCGCGLVSGQGQSRYPENATSHAPVCQAPTPIPERPNCGCGNASVSVNCKKLMEQIRAVDFALYETVLYLDVYPHSCDALETYRKLKAQSDALHAEYESVCGPLTAFGNKGDSWDWMGKPFPWEYDAE